MSLQKKKPCGDGLTRRKSVIGNSLSCLSPSNHCSSQVGDQYSFKQWSFTKLKEGC
uniref:Uncharacterized protein n=1 Tax=Octopus bimaculoides TaxID=37653 RepID=A0A0L8GCT2_OCTBM